jgi:hypothetical protein
MIETIVSIVSYTSCWRRCKAEPGVHPSPLGTRNPSRAGLSGFRMTEKVRALRLGQDRFQGQDGQSHPFCVSLNNCRSSNIRG